MPSFDARKTELRGRLRDTTADLQPIELVRMTAVLEDFFSLRDSALTTVTTIVADTGSDDLARDYTDKLTGFRQQISQKLGDMLSGLSDPSKAAVQFRERVLVEETGFWGAPGLAGLGAARDDLMHRIKALQELGAALDKKWQALTDEDLRVEQAEEDAAKKVRDIIRTAMSQQADLVKQLGNLTGNILQTYSKIDDQVNDWVVTFAIAAGVPENIARLIPKMSSLAQGAFDAAKELGIPAAQFALALAPLLLKDPGFAAVEWLKSLAGSDIRDLLTVYSSFKKGLIYALQTPYYDQVNTYRSVSASHSALIVTFAGTRHYADDFIQTSNNDAARRALDVTFSNLDSWAGGYMTSGLQSDAGQVRTLARDALNGRLAAYADIFNQLFQKYSGRFLGPLATETDRQLINTDFWVVTTNGMVEIGLDDGVNDWRSNITEFQARLTDSFSRVEPAFELLPTELRDRIREPVDAYLDATLRQLNGEVEDTQRALDACKLAVNGRKFGTDFDRSDLQAKLRS